MLSGNTPSVAMVFLPIMWHTWSSLYVLTIVIANIPQRCLWESARYWHMCLRFQSPLKYKSLFLNIMQRRFSLIHVMCQSFSHPSLLIIIWLVWFDFWTTMNSGSLVTFHSIVRFCQKLGFVKNMELVTCTKDFLVLSQSQFPRYWTFESFNYIRVR